MTLFTNMTTTMDPAAVMFFMILAVLLLIAGVRRAYRRWRP